MLLRGSCGLCVLLLLMRGSASLLVGVSQGVEQVFNHPAASQSVSGTSYTDPVRPHWTATVGALRSKPAGWCVIGCQGAAILTLCAPVGLLLLVWCDASLLVGVSQGV
jgi:hypothetical protein